MVAGTAVLLIVLLAMIPPHGTLSANEENYFALARRFVGSGMWPPETAVFDVSRHRALSDATLGLTVWAIGYTPAQIVTRLLVVLGYALALPLLFGGFALSAFDAAVAVMSMALIGQDIVGGEWLFSGYEAKVAAYILVLPALRFVLVKQRLIVSTLLFALATYIHFLVGGFWFIAAMALRLIYAPRDLARVAATIALYLLTVTPLCGVIVWSRLADDAAALAPDVPSPDVIYSIIREPHHQSPFLSWPYFRENWLSGYVVAAPMLLACVLLVRTESSRRLRAVAVWLACLLAYLFLVLGPKYLDRNIGILGKFYLFRPSSLIELLWLMLVLAYGMQIAGRRALLLRVTLAATIGSLFLYVQGGRLMREIDTSSTLEAQKAPMIAAVTRLTAPGDVVLIDPDIEPEWLDFERRTWRPTYVAWKFAPTNDAELIAWYRRIGRRSAIFDKGCGVPTDVAHPVFLLTTPASASRFVAGCGSEVFRSDRWVLRRQTPGAG